MKICKAPQIELFPFELIHTYTYIQYKHIVLRVYCSRVVVKPYAS